MPFSPRLREEALVQSQRRCCVCHEFAGRAINVHHIIQAANGGSNDLDNAIVLCLRCHSEAGHFNPRHPIGTKYSPSELRRHRDNWWAAIKSGKVSNLSCVLDVAWKRTYLSSRRHTHQLIVTFQNGPERMIDEWKLHVELPSIVPVRTQDIDQLQDVRRDGVTYSVYEITGGKIFPGEESELVGEGLVCLEYDMTDVVFDHPRRGDFTLASQFYSTRAPPLHQILSWSAMHQF